MLPGLLAKNQTESRRLSDYLLNININTPDKEKRLFHGLVDAVPDDDADQENWSKDDWYCLDCIRVLFRQRFMVWWRNAKVKSTGRPLPFMCAFGLTGVADGDPVQDDCWCVVLFLPHQVPRQPFQQVWL